MTLLIRPLSTEEMVIPLDWARQEGWNPGLSDGPCFYHVDPNGFLGAFLNGQPVATISAVRYGDAFGFMGFYIVSPEHRGKGYGLQLWHAALKHLDGLPSIGLDGVVAQQDNYRKSGFIYTHRNGRFKGVTPFPSSQKTLESKEQVDPAKDLDFDALCAFDAVHFPTRRADFLRCWMSRPGHRALVIHNSHRVVAYGVIRPCHEGYKIGPLFCENARQAYILIQALCADLPDSQTVFLDLPMENTAALALASDFGMSMIFETARMYRGDIPLLPIQQIYGITSFELG